MIVTSTSPSEDWGETFGDEVVAAPMIDGVVHHAEIRSLNSRGFETPVRLIGIDTPETRHPSKPVQ